MMSIYFYNDRTWKSPLKQTFMGAYSEKHQRLILEEG